MKRAIATLLIIFAIGSLSMMNRNPTEDKLAAAITSINSLRLQHIASLDSFLVAYPAYFLDSNVAIREKKYEELAFYFRRATGFMVGMQPDLYYEKLISFFQFKKNKRKGFFGIVPNSWLFIGPTGNEPDSVLKKYRKQDTLAEVMFIKDAVAQYREEIREINTHIHLDTHDATMVFDVLRKEMFRISSLDIGNSDFVIDDAALPALNGSVNSWLQYADVLFSQLPASEQELQHLWSGTAVRTKQYLASNNVFSRFNRMYFIKDCLIPLSQAFNRMQVALHVPISSKWSAVRNDAVHLYDKNVFNADFFAPNDDGYFSAEKAKLGELLFFDPILSDNNRRACASCHKPQLAFTDGRPKAASFDQDDLPRNSPTVINAGFQKKTFWDMRAASMEDQLDSVINNPSELHSSFEHVIERINASPEYVAGFHKAFPATRKNGITRQDVKNAIGVYERTLTGLNSRFDQYMRGDDSKLSASEINGFNVYMGKAKCGTCHFAPLFNGAVPPFYDVTEHHAIGVPVKDSMVKYALDQDPGMFKVTNNGFTRFSFKTPTVRNAALTAPYMHNGAFKTMEQVIDFYDRAAGARFIGDYGKQMMDVPFFTILPIELKLTPVEKKDLIAFIGALTDTSAAHIPARLPALKGKYATANKRIIGGVY